MLYMESSAVCDKTYIIFVFQCFGFFCFLSWFYLLVPIIINYNTSVGGGLWGNFNSMHVANVKKKQTKKKPLPPGPDSVS